MNGAVDDGAPPQCLLRLYSTNRRQEAASLAAEIKGLLASRLPGRVRVEVIDILDDIGLAVAYGIFITPTLVRELPGPMRRVTGDLSDPRRVLTLLGLCDLP